MKNLSFECIKINDGFWDFYNKLNRKSVVKNVCNRFKETGRFDALRCDWREGTPNKPHIYWDSDVVKWIEGVAYLIEESPKPELEALVDEMIDNIAQNQRSDGYFNSYFLSVEPSKIFTDRDCHELYCVGHTIEAAIAYHKATGKDKLLNCVLKNVDMIYRVFVEEQSAAFVTPGHEEIELALLKLYDYLGNEKHLELARFFIDQRGNNDKEEKSFIDQSNLPLREISEAVGHSVRACYLYTAMAMLAKIDGDDKLKAACNRVFDDIVNCKMSITGGVGADHKGEQFSYKYDLPNSDTYNETCAAISLAMFAGAMQEMEVNSRYGDVIERIYYNGFISGLSLDGEKFFYTNPLEIDRKKYARSTYQPICERVKVFNCSCCPPNVLRMLASIPRYMYTTDGDTVYCNQFATSETKLEIGGKEATITQATDYPYNGKITFNYSGEPMTLYVRIPDWCVEYEGDTENGFARFELSDGDSVTVDLPMEIHFIEANPYAQDNSGRYAVQRGPAVYCMEEIDNGENLRDITLLENSEKKVVCEEGIPAPVIYMGAERRPATNQLYSIKNDERVSFTARLIPYFAFANREASDMLVWTMVK
ncbi:MAG: glycoside hydrolase family 127 protein [Oscillospiraceae bacterium]|nr:glycoside hydrolase family 127 protein [Oscillospiraceae bacterium]